MVGVFLILFGVLNDCGKPTYAFAAILMYLFILQTTDNAVTWLYCSEIAVDVGLGFTGVAGYFIIFLLTFGIKPMESSFLGLAGTFYLLGTEQLLSGLWSFLYLKETSGGLTDKQKKSLYMPDDLKEY